MEYLVKSWENYTVAGPFESGAAARAWVKANIKDVTGYYVACEV